MDTIDSIKRRLDGFLPGKHRILLLGLVCFLIIITHQNEYPGPTLILRNSAAELAAASPAFETIAETGEKDPAINTALINKGEIDSFIVSEVSFDLPTNLSAPSTMPLPAETEITGQSSGPDFVTKVKSGDNLTLIFARAGLSARDVYEVSNSEPKSSLLSNLYPGYELEFYFDHTTEKGNELVSLNVIKNKLESVEFKKIEEGYFTANENYRQPEVRQVFREATIDDSLFLAAQRGGMSAGVTMELAGIFGGVIDFLLDTRKGDTFNLLYEEQYIDGEYIGYGAIQASQFTNQGETYTAVRYRNSEGSTDFYNPEGESMRKAFLRNPVDFTRISDGFNPRRKHPILNTIRAHKGTDYAAPRGTPVVAAGDGRITWASRNGSFGKLVVVQHGEKFQTKYAHLNDYAKGVKTGSRVRQGQVIGYVGSTGGATGPHLHYEFLMDGVHRNSRTIHDKLPKAESVPDAEMQRFMEQSQILLAQLETHASTTRNIAQLTVNPKQ